MKYSEMEMISQKYFDDIYEDEFNKLLGESKMRMEKNCTRSISSFLERTRLPNKIKCKAEGIYNTLPGCSHKKEKLEDIGLGCVILAYKHLGIHAPPNVMIRLCNLPDDLEIRALNMIQEVFPEMNIDSNPEQEIFNMIKYYTDQLSMENLIDDICQFSRDILNKDSELVEGYPQEVAAGIVMVYCENNGISLTKKRVEEISGISITTLKRIDSVITELDAI